MASMYKDGCADYIFVRIVPGRRWMLVIRVSGRREKDQLARQLLSGCRNTSGVAGGMCTRAHSAHSSLMSRFVVERGESISYQCYALHCASSVTRWR